MAKSNGFAGVKGRPIDSGVMRTIASDAGALLLGAADRAIIESPTDSLHRLE
jgi:hypothetical protein